MVLSIILLKKPVQPPLHHCLQLSVLQVIAILAHGEKLPFEVVAVKLELPELQGEPEEIAQEKCRLAAKEVGGAGKQIFSPYKIFQFTKTYTEIKIGFQCFK